MSEPACDRDNNMIAETIGLTTTVYIGNIYEKKDQGGTITEKKLYYAGSLRVAVSTKVGTGSWEVNFLLSDHLGSTSITTDDSGVTVSEMRYSPWGSVRFSEGLSPTDFTYIGQLSVENFGLMYYNARWYDVYLKRWAQPDKIIPDYNNPLDLDRYSYVRNNPIVFMDPSGKTPVYISGWDDAYRQTQVGNTCAVVSIAVVLSIHRGYKITQDDIQSSMFNRTSGTFGVEEWGIGVPPWEQSLKLEAYRDIEATSSRGNRSDLMSNLNNDIPTIVSFALPYSEGWAHAVVLIGHDPATGDLIFFNPASGKKETDSAVYSYYNNIWVNATGKSFSSFDDLWAETNLAINNNMVTVEYVDVILPENIITGGGGEGNQADMVFY